MPPSPFGFIALAALMPLFISLRKAASIAEAVRIGLTFALIFNLLSLYFIAFNSGTTVLLGISSYIGLTLIISIFGIIFAIPQYLLFRRFRDYGYISVPFIWTTVEYLRSLGEIGFPWNITPLTQADYLPVMQIVSVTGIWGLSFWISASGAILAFILSANRKIIPAVVLGLWLLFPFIYGSAILRNPPAVSGSIKVGLVQGNIDPADKWSMGLNYSLDVYGRLTSELNDVQMAVWPETAVPSNLRYQVRSQRFLFNLSDSLNIPIFTGALGDYLDEGGKEYRHNSAFLIRPDSRELEQYDKIHPVPFGERVPFQRYFPALGKLNLGQAEFTPGEDYHIFNLGEASFGAMICFESIFPEMGRKYTAAGAGFFVNITNDGWYGKTAEPYQHALLTRFRAVESRRSIVRAANTGISYISDGYGRFIVKSGLLKEAVLTAELPLYNEDTCYNKHGDVFARTVLILSLITTTLSFIPGKKARRLIISALFIILFFIYHDDGLAKDRFMTLSCSQARSISLSNPSTMMGNISDMPENPACFSQYKNPSRIKLDIYLNPIGAAAAGAELWKNNNEDDISDEDRALIPAALFVKGFAISYRLVNIGAVFSEQYPPGLEAKKFFGYYPIFDSYYNRIFLQLDLDKRVAVGVSARLFMIDQEIDRVGYSYGVLLKPGKLNVGVFYSILPEKYSQVFHPVKRLIKDSINAGISWEMPHFMKWYLGLRNLSEEGEDAFLEPHAAAEIVMLKHLSLRGGYYRENGQKDAFTIGVGLLDLNEFRALEDELSQRDFVIDYGFSILPDENTLHSISMYIKL